MRLRGVLLCCFMALLGNVSATCDPAHPPKLELFYSPYCYYSLKVLNYLKSIDKTVPLRDVVDNVKAKEELRDKGGKMQVPCLFINDQPLYESDLIVQWLSENQECLQGSSKPHDLLE